MCGYSIQGEILALASLECHTDRPDGINAHYVLGQGAHPKVVQERLGHSQVGITLNTYSHVLPGLGREAIERLGATLHDGEGDEATGPMGEREQEPEDDARG